MKNNNQVWNFFASVKLALFTLCTIAITSIIGTLIPQKEQFGFYASRYGEGMARFFQVLDIPDMYGSWWFLGLLGLLSANLMVCSIDRFPAVWKQMTMDQSAIPWSRLTAMTLSQSYNSPSLPDPAVLESILKKQGWKIQKSISDSGLIISGQKGAWTRTGVYIVHVSILVIFAGAIIGSLLGFKGSVMLPETKKTARIYTTGTQAPIDLGFEVECDLFEIEFYENGMVKEYRSRLRVYEDGKEVLVKDIEVNDPLRYRGITFYQSSYEAYRDFLVSIGIDESTGRKSFVTPFQKQVEWKENEMTFGIINAEAVRDRVVRLKIWLKAGDSEPTTFWVGSQEEKVIDYNGSKYTIYGKQMYATGLQVAKDPGVWLVYVGCGMMMFGLYLAFFMSHRKVWIGRGQGEHEGTLHIAGTANKNKVGFEKVFEALQAAVSETLNTNTKTS